MTSMDLTYVITYLTIAILLWYLISEIFKSNTGMHRWSSIGFVVVVLLLIGWTVWSNYKNEKTNLRHDHDRETSSSKNVSIEDDENIEDDVEEDVTVHKNFVQSKYKTQAKTFTFSKGAAEDLTSIQYKDFKKWYLTSTFLNKYMDAIKQGLDIQEQQLKTGRKNCLKEIHVLNSKDKKLDGIAGIMQTLSNKTGDTKMLERAVSEIDYLLKVVAKKRKTLTVEKVRKNFIIALSHPQKGLDSLVGRDDIKNFIALQLYTFSRNPRIFMTKFQNIILEGASGIGKTKLAEVIGHVYSYSGIILRNVVGIHTKQAMTTAFVNESGNMTRRLLLSHLGGIVFIDEAYDLGAPKTAYGQGIDHGHEAIAEMVNFIDKMKGLCLIIAAGYRKDMEERFVKANDGIPRRFPHKRVLKRYDSKELTTILLRFLSDMCSDIKIEETHGNYIYTIINHICELDKETKRKNKLRKGDKVDRIFEHQAGDMENLSGHISRSIYGTPGKDWVNNTDELIMSGINAYLSSNNISMKSVNIK